MIRTTAFASALLLIATPALGADQPRQISVAGHATIRTMPDVATISFSVRGEGKTSDEAVQALVDHQRAISAALSGFIGSGGLTGAKISQRAARDPSCKSGDDDNAPRLSTGNCAIVGYIAELPLTVRTAAVNQAATIVGLIGRLGGRDPDIESFALSNPAGARSQAIAAALADARQRAEALAAGANVRLGQVLSVTDGERSEATMDIVVTGSIVPAPVVSPPPIVVNAKPEPVETEARVTVTYAIAPSAR